MQEGKLVLLYNVDLAKGTQPLDPNDIHHLDDFGLFKVSKALKVEFPANLNSSRWGMSFGLRGRVSFVDVYIIEQS